MLDSTPASTRILLVEDDEAKRYTLARGLRASGFEIVEVGTGQAALEQVRELPDLVILDLKLPDVDGFDVCRKIKLDPQTSGVLVLELSARYSTPNDRARGLDGGADAYLVHPVEFSVLIATMRSLLRLRDMERERARLLAEFSASEQRYRIVTETATVGLCQLDREGRCEFMNPAAERITGLRSADVRGHVLDDLIRGGRPDGSSLALEESPLQSVLRGGPPVREHRDFVRRSDGSWLPVRLSASPIVSGARLLGAVVEIKDDSALARAERTRELFLAALGHDLRNPLQTMAVGCELLRQGGSLSDSGVRTVDRMVANVRRMNRLIEQTLVLAQTLVDRVPLDRRECDLATVIGEIVHDARMRAPGRPIELVSPPRVVCSCDPDRLGQVVDNLLANAIRHGDGAVKLVLEECGGDELEITVHNHGAPITATALPTLFDPFRRAGRAGGVGLGLYIVAQIVNAHGGSVSVASDAESGTTFRVRLPRAATLPS